MLFSGTRQSRLEAEKCYNDVMMDAPKVPRSKLNTTIILVHNFHDLTTCSQARITFLNGQSTSSLWEETSIIQHPQFFLGAQVNCEVLSWEIFIRTKTNLLQERCFRIICVVMELCRTQSSGEIHNATSFPFPTVWRMLIRNIFSPFLFSYSFNGESKGQLPTIQDHRKILWSSLYLPVRQVRPFNFLSLSSKEWFLNNSTMH